MWLEKHWVNHINTLNTACTAFSLCCCWMPVKKTCSFWLYHFFWKFISLSPLQSLVVANGGLGNGVGREELSAALTEMGELETLIMNPHKPYAFVTYRCCLDSATISPGRFLTLTFLAYFAHECHSCFQVGRVCSESSRPAQRRKATVWREQRHALPQFRQLRYVRLNTHRRKSISWSMCSMLCLCVCSPMWRGGVRPVARRISRGGGLCLSRGRSSAARCSRLVVCQWWCHWWDLLFLCLVLIFWLTCLNKFLTSLSIFLRHSDVF